VGGWGQRKTGEVIWELLEEVDPGVEDEIARQAEELRLWMGDRMLIPRFRSPLYSELGGAEGGTSTET
jgi:hypothetical protein